MAWYEGNKQKKTPINLSDMKVKPFNKKRHWSLLCCGYPENRRKDPYKPNVAEGNWYKRVLAAVTVEPFNYENASMEDTDYDVNERMDQAEGAFNKSKIRYDSTKNISHVAVENGQVIGAVASGWSQDNSMDVPTSVFSFDVAVNPEHRGPQMAGIKLIAEAVKYYDSTKNEYQDMGNQVMMRLWVVNPRLVPVLEAKFGFTIEADHGDGGCHMVRY